MNASLTLNPLLFEKPEKKATRDGFGEALLELGKKDERVVALTADLGESVRTAAFEKAFPNRFFEVGITEQFMIAAAAGLALEGKVPFATTFANFGTGRVYDFIRQSVCYNQANVKIAVTHAGITLGEDGATHQMLEDLGMMRTLPHMTVVCPCDYLETKKAVFAIAEHVGPSYLRMGRANVPLITTDATPFRMGHANVLREGKDVSIAACGVMVYPALVAAKELEKEHKISAEVVNHHSLKPFDAATLVKSAKKCGAIVTAEEHQRTSGLRAACAEVLTEQYPVPLQYVAVEDTFGESGTPDALLQKYGLTKDNVVKKALAAVKMKK